MPQMHIGSRHMPALWGNSGSSLDHVSGEVKARPTGGAAAGSDIKPRMTGKPRTANEAEDLPEKRFLL